MKMDSTSRRQTPVDAGGGRLLDNLMHFARVLRGCGFAVGPGQVLQAVDAVGAVGLGRREDFYWTLHAVFVNRAQQRELFEQAFHVFWRNPRLLERLLGLALPELPRPAASDVSGLSRRLGEAMGARARLESRADPAPPEVEADAAMTWSGQEVLRGKDFEQMSAAEIERAKAAVAAMRLPLAEVPTRRYQIRPRGPRVDMRASLRAALRSGHASIALVRSRRRRRAPPLVILCDISGSMSRYSRMLLHFAHTLTGDRERVSSFVFGTRLTNITRYLREKDVDDALGKVAVRVQDWDGGTRIGRCLRQFNQTWSRRVLGQGAVVLLITDGLDRDVGRGLIGEMERLRKSCRRLIWLNPLLRYAGFEPRALGMRAMLPHVHELRTVHNLDSLESLTAALSGRGASGDDVAERNWRLAS